MADFRMRHSRKTLGLLGAGVGLAVLIGLLVGPTPIARAQQSAGVTYPAWQSPRLFGFPGKWSAAPKTTVRLFFPAQASWEWVTGAEHPGSLSVRAGTACAACHGNPIVGKPTVGGWAGPPADHKEGLGCQACHGTLVQKVETLGAKLVAHPTLEQAPIRDKRPAVDVEVQAAYDREYFYLRASWPSARPGIMHDLWRFDGVKWVKWGGPKPDAPKKGKRPSYEDRLAIMLSDRDLPAVRGLSPQVAQVGCWVSCHQDLRAMPRHPTKKAVQAHPYFGKEGLKKKDVRKYLLLTRKAATGETWSQVRSKEEIEDLFRRGEFLDLWMWRGARSGPIGYADDFYVLDYRFGDKGKSMFKTPKTPAYMYDAEKLGFSAVPEDRFEELLTRLPLIEGVNAAPFDPAAGFKKGDLLPRRLLRIPDGSRGDILANSVWRDGRWTVELRRKLDTGNPDDKTLTPGRIYTVGLAVFDDMVSNRRHHVSFPLTLGLGLSADITAAPLAPGDGK